MTVLTPRLVYQDADYWLVNKPAGMSFHAESQTLGFMQWLKQTFPDEDFYPVHRLDRITSGLIIVAKNKKAAQSFGQMFASHQVTKYYLALSAKKPKKKQGSIKGGMQSGRRGSWMLTQSNENFAHTQFFSCQLRQGVRLFLLKPKTGKTHQLRVALKSLGAPILGDTRYGGEKADRGYLHAFSLSFEWDGVLKQYQYLPDEGEAFAHVEACLNEHDFLMPDQLPWPKK